jgi:hypothetical protein
MASNAQVYNDGQIQFGSWIINLLIGPRSLGGNFSAPRGTYIFENIRINRPVKLIKRPDELGGPNGFVMVTEYNEATCTIQLGSAGSSAQAIVNGDYFTNQFNTLNGSESFALGNITEPYEMDGYWKRDGTFIKCNFTPAPFTFTPN